MRPSSRWKGQLHQLLHTGSETVLGAGPAPRLLAIAENLGASMPHGGRCTWFISEALFQVGRF